MKGPLFLHEYNLVRTATTNPFAGLSKFFINIANDVTTNGCFKFVHKIIFQSVLEEDFVSRTADKFRKYKGKIMIAD